MLRNIMRKKQNPSLQLSWNKAELILLAAAIVSILASVILLAWYYGELPAEIPTHFGINGEADAYGGKSSILWLFFMQLFLLILSVWSICHPQYYNMPVKITEKNAEPLYRLGRFFMSLVNGIICWMLFYVLYKSIHIAMGENTAFGWVLWVFLGLLTACIVLLTLQARRIAKRSDTEAS